MHNFFLSIAFVLLVAPALAQSPFIAPSVDPARHAEREAQRNKTQKLWDAYRINPSRAGHKALGEIASTRSLRPTRSNTADVLRLLEAQGNTDDHQMYARLANDLHNDLVEERGDESLKRDIREALVRVIKNAKEPSPLRRTAMFSYSRMGYFPDSLALLKSTQPLLGDRDYYGELAHLLGVAPESAQDQIIKELEYAGGRNTDYAKEILANGLRHTAVVGRLSPEVARGLLALLKKREPPFNQGNPEAMGVFSLSMYADWVAAVARLTSRTTGAPLEFVLAKMIKMDDDPRKLIALLFNHQSAADVRSALAGRDLDKVDATIAAFATKYSSNLNVQDFTSIARTHLAKK